MELYTYLNKIYNTDKFNKENVYINYNKLLNDYNNLYNYMYIYKYIKYIPKKYYKFFKL